MPQNMPDKPKPYRGADAYKSFVRSKPKKSSGSGAKKPDYRSGGMFRSGRAIKPAPGTKERRKFRDSDTKLGKPSGVKRGTYKSGGLYKSGRAIAQAPGTKKNSRVTTPKPSKSASKGYRGNMGRRSADSYGSPNKYKRK